MRTTKTLSPSMLEASKKAASFQYDNSKYIIVSANVRRDSETGRLILDDENA